MSCMRFSKVFHGILEVDAEVVSRFRPLAFPSHSLRSIVY
jgi:hypothetical protein